ncbi:MAG: HAD family hydrolase [Myxococcota bacterium]
MSAPLRICTWSGPRNVSTALMRSFEARGDCAVVDEPLYAAFLAATGKLHPGREEILAVQPQDPGDALRVLREARPGTPLQYEKHMAHHWQPGWDWAAVGPARHVLLIRSPARVVASYARVREDPLPEDLGLDQQVALLAHLGGDAVVVDGDALLADPPGELRALCEALGIGFTERMLRWPAGRRATDGVWAPHWYARVEASTGFAAPEPPAEVPARLQWLVAALQPPTSASPRRERGDANASGAFAS